MTALADHLAAQHGRGSYRGPGGAGSGPVAVPGPAVPADRPGTVRGQARTVRSWPLLLLAFPAAAEVWSGWVGIALHSLVPLGLFSLIGRIHHSPGKNAHPYVRRQAAKRSTRAAVKRLSTTLQDLVRVFGI